MTVLGLCCVLCAVCCVLCAVLCGCVPVCLCGPCCVARCCALIRPDCYGRSRPIHVRFTCRQVPPAAAGGARPAGAGRGPGRRAHARAAAQSRRDHGQSHGDVSGDLLSATGGRGSRGQGWAGERLEQGGWGLQAKRQQIGRRPKGSACLLRGFPHRSRGA